MKTPTPAFRKILAGYYIWWACWIVIDALVLHNLGFAWTIALTDGFISNIYLAFTGYVMSNILRYYQPSRKKNYQLLAWSIAFAAGNVVLLHWSLKFLFLGMSDYLVFLENSLLLRFAISWLMIVFMSLLSWMWYYMKEQQENESRKVDADKLAREAELFKLRQQLQPHFLFNSLNSISALLGSKPEEARKMIQQLSDFLRITIKKDDNKLVSLADEMQHLQLYLAIEKVRFGHRLNTTFDIAENSLTKLVPSLIIQPIAENAIKFGLYDTLDDVNIKISTSVDNHLLIIKVENPFDPDTSLVKTGTGFGLKSIKRRLHLLYSRHDLLETQKIDHQFITTVRIPQYI